MNEKEVTNKNIVIALGVISIIFLVGLVGAIASYTSQVNSLNSQIANLQSQIKSWRYNWRQWNSKIPNETMTTEDFSVAPIWRIRFEFNGTFLIPQHPDGGYRTARITVYRWVPLNSIYEREVVIVIDFTTDFSSVCLDFIGEFHLSIQPYGYIENWAVSIDEYR